MFIVNLLVSSVNVTDRKNRKIAKNLFQSSCYPLMDNATAILFCLSIIPFFKVFFVFTLHRKCFTYFNGLLQDSKLFSTGWFLIPWKLVMLKDFVWNLLRCLVRYTETSLFSGLTLKISMQKIFKFTRNILC